MVSERKSKKLKEDPRDVLVQKEQDQTDQKKISEHFFQKGTRRRRLFYNRKASDERLFKKKQCYIIRRRRLIYNRKAGDESLKRKKHYIAAYL